MLISLDNNKRVSWAGNIPFYMYSNMYYAFIYFFGIKSFLEAHDILSNCNHQDIKSVMRLNVELLYFVAKVKFQKIEI